VHARIFADSLEVWLLSHEAETVRSASHAGAVRSFRSYEFPAQVQQIGHSAAESEGVIQKSRSEARRCTKAAKVSDRIIGSRFQDFVKRELFRYGDLEEIADQPWEAVFIARSSCPGRSIREADCSGAAHRCQRMHLVRSAYFSSFYDDFQLCQRRNGQLNRDVGFLGLEAFAKVDSIRLSKIWNVSRAI